MIYRVSKAVDTIFHEALLEGRKIVKYQQNIIDELMIYQGKAINRR